MRCQAQLVLIEPFWETKFQEEEKIEAKTISISTKKRFQIKLHNSPLTLKSIIIKEYRSAASEM